jgi:L-threonylcarbamoyladenylate synthase
MITLVADLTALERTVEKVPDVAYELIECTDRPLTIVYDRGVGVTPELMGEDKTLAVRLTREKFSSALCRALRKPLVSTSANISGQPTPKSFALISQEIRDAVDYVCTSRRDEPVDTNAKPSMVMRLSDDGLFKILRK